MLFAPVKTKVKDLSKRFEFMWFTEIIIFLTLVTLNIINISLLTMAVFDMIYVITYEDFI